MAGKKQPSSQDEFTTSRINALGERLRKGEPGPEDLRYLDSYRRSFDNAYNHVVSALRELGLEPSGRIKTTVSVVEKLKRQSFRLSKLQDIAGCRIVVSGVPEQDRAIESISKAFPNAKVIDRRQRDSHGYRAVHLVVEVNDRFVEIQVRTELQHLWAVWSEALADKYGQALKYGAGPDEIQLTLTIQSIIFSALEIEEDVIAKRLKHLIASKPLPAEVADNIELFGDVKDLIKRKEAEKDRIESEILKLRRERNR